MKKQIGDIVLSTTVVIQFFLIILQHCMIGILYMDQDVTTSYRIVLSALPVIISMYFILRRDLLFAISVLLLIIIVMLLHSVIFPENSEYIWTQGVRFLLPVCVPTMLAMRSIENFEIFNKVVNIISWASIILLFLYTIYFVLGVVVIDNYNMSFGYGLLLPTLVLYRQNKIISKICFVFSFISILAIGSRGPLLVIILYMLYDVFKYNRKYIPVLMIIVVSASALVVPMVEYFDSIGINSRTLNLFLSGNLSQDSGRGVLSEITLHAIKEHPVLGLGIFSDRVLLNGTYCHNLILELMLNWGIPISILFILVIIFLSIKVYRNLYNKDQKTLYVVILISCIVPLLLSSSYLIDSKFWIFLGILLFFAKKIKYKI